MAPTKVTVLAFDPGGHTGIAIFSGIRAKEEYFATEYPSFTLGPEPHHSKLWGVLNNYFEEADEFHLVHERFDFRQGKTGLDMSAREYIGIVNLFLQLHPHIKGMFWENAQMPSQGKGFVQDNNLKKMGLWKPGEKYKHEMDAYRHLFWYLIHKAKIMPTEFLKAGWK